MRKLEEWEGNGYCSSWSCRAILQSLTAIATFHRVPPILRKQLTSLILLLVLAGSAFAGVPMHSGESECSMSQAMADMDCCKAALMGSQSPEATAARLCCAINCSHEGSTPPSSLRGLPQSQPAVSDYQPSTPALPASLLLTARVNRAHGPPIDSHPAYIRHLALLI